jgi:hypothetical protein
MADCNNLSNLTPYETYRCLVDADAWKVIQRNGQKMWADFSGTTNGEWLGITLALVTIPAQFASYILPLYFIARVFNRARRHGDVTATAKQKASKTRWGWYLIVCDHGVWVSPGQIHALSGDVGDPLWCGHLPVR